MNDDFNEDEGKLIDKHIENLNPKVRQYLIRKAFEEYMRILWMERDGDKWHDCSKCQYFNALKSDKKGTKIFMKKGFFGYCLNSNHTNVKSKKGGPLNHLIYKDHTGIEFPHVIIENCSTPKSQKKENFLALMLKQEEDAITKLLMETSLKEEERNYFEDLKKKYQEQL